MQCASRGANGPDHLGLCAGCQVVLYAKVAVSLGTELNFDYGRSFKRYCQRDMIG